MLDATGIRIGGNPGSGLPAVVLFTGDSYAIFWTEQTFTEISTTDSVHVARVDRDGHLIDPPRLLIDDAYAGVDSLAFNGSRIAVFTSSKLYLLDASAHVVTTTAIPMPEPNVSDGVVGTNGNTFLLTWAGDAGSGVELDSLEVDANGKAIGTPQQLAAHVVGGPICVASNGADYAILYNDHQLFHDLVIGHATQTASVATHALGSPTSPTWEASLLWNGSSYVLSWTQAVLGPQNQAVFAQRIAADGTPIDPTGFTIAPQAPFGPAAEFSVALNGTTLQYVWMSRTDDPYSEFDIHGMAVSARDLRLTNETLISQSTNEQLAPDFAFSGRNYLAVWKEDGGIYASRVSLDGHALDGRGIQLSSTANTAQPRVLFDGMTYIVAYEQTVSSVSTLQVTRIDPDTGVLLDGEGHPVVEANCAFPFDVANNGLTTLVVYTPCVGGGLDAFLVNRAVQPVTLPLWIVHDVVAGNPSIAWSGGEWLVAYNEMKLIPCSCLISPAPMTPYPVNVDAVRLTPELTPIDTMPIAIAGTGDIDDPQAAPHAASSGSDFLVTWSRTKTGEVLARHLDLNGAQGETSVVGSGLVTSTIWTGSEYAAAFTSSTALNGATLGTIAHPQKVREFRIDAGVVARLVSTMGRITAAYQRLATEPLYGGVNRIFVRDASPVRVHAALR